MQHIRAVQGNRAHLLHSCIGLLHQLLKLLRCLLLKPACAQGQGQYGPRPFDAPTRLRLPSTRSAMYVYIDDSVAALLPFQTCIPAQALRTHDPSQSPQAPVAMAHGLWGCALCQPTASYLQRWQSQSKPKRSCSTACLAPAGAKSSLPR